MVSWCYIPPLNEYDRYRNLKITGLKRRNDDIGNNDWNWQFYQC